MKRVLSAAAVLLAFAAGVAGCERKGGDTVSERSGATAAATTTSDFPCVHFDQLRRHLPDAVQGYSHLREEGSSGRYGQVSISEAERVFEGEEGQELSIRIVDTTLSGDLARAIRAAAKDASTRPSDDPVAPILEDSAVGFVRFDANQQKAEANVLVADRFVVAVTSLGVDGTGDVRRVAGSIDYDALALLR